MLQSWCDVDLAQRHLASGDTKAMPCDAYGDVETAQSCLESEHSKAMLFDVCYTAGLCQLRHSISGLLPQGALVMIADTHAFSFSQHCTARASTARHDATGEPGKVQG